nr:hypothetical protein [Bartonella sp. B1098]
MAFLLAVMAIGLAILSVNTHTFVVFPVYFMIGFGLSSWALSISLSQLSCDPEYQGRLQASFNVLSSESISLWQVIAVAYHHNRYIFFKALLRLWEYSSCCFFINMKSDKLH